MWLDQVCGEMYFLSWKLSRSYDGALTAVGRQEFIGVANTSALMTKPPPADL